MQTLAEKDIDYVISFQILVAHTERHFCLVVPEAFAHELNLKYTASYAQNELNANPDVFYITPVKKMGVRPGKKHVTSKNGDEFRLLQFQSFPDLDVPYFGRTPATLWIRHDGTCKIVVTSERAPQRKVVVKANKTGIKRGKNDDPIPMGKGADYATESAHAADVLRTTGHAATASRAWTKAKNLETEIISPGLSAFIAPEPLTTDFIRMCVASVNRFLRETPNCTVETFLGEPRLPDRSAQQIKITVTEEFQ